MMNGKKGPRIPICTARLGRFLVALVLAAIAGGASQSSIVRDEAVVAVIGDREIIAADVRERVTELRRRELAEGRLSSFGSDVYRTVFESIVDVKRFALEARRQGLDLRPDVARRVVNRVDDILAEVLLQELEGATSEEALRAYYDAHPGEFKSPGRVRARHIVVRSSEEAESVLRKLNGGAEFETLARENNIDSTRAVGGDLGWIRPGVMVRSFDEALFSLEQGEVSSIVRTYQGFHIVRADEIEVGKLLDFKEAKESIRRRLIDARIRVLRNQLTVNFPVKVNEELLEDLAQ
jgi:peptidyl-prolyl cis-trans isomerase C